MVISPTLLVQCTSNHQISVIRFKSKLFTCDNMCLFIEIKDVVIFYSFVHTLTLLNCI